MTIARMIEGRDGAVITCDVAASVRDAVAILAERRIGALPVLANGEVAGIFSERDVLYRLNESGASVLDRPTYTLTFTRQPRARSNSNASSATSGERKQAPSTRPLALRRSPNRNCRSPAAQPGPRCRPPLSSSTRYRRNSA